MGLRDFGGRTISRWRRAVLFGLGALTVGAPCCGGGLDSGRPSQVAALRVLAVTAEHPYLVLKPPPETGVEEENKVTFRMTYADALDVNGGGPREVEVRWLGGCYNPIGDTFETCFPQLQAVLQGIASGTVSPKGLVDQYVLGPEKSGVPDAASFELTLRSTKEMFKEARLAANGTPFTTAYLFFAVCAGHVRPVENQPEEGLEFPLECVDKKGNVLGPDSFVVGYTQVYIFADGRTNSNPEVLGLTLDGVAIEGGMENAPKVARCESAAPADQQGAGCGPPPEPSDCKTYKIEAVVDDVAEVDVEVSRAGEAPVREAVWVDYFADGGSFDGAKKLVSDTASGYRADHETTWIPPAEAGLVSLWAVAHDGRGGASVTQQFVVVE